MKTGLETGVLAFCPYLIPFRELAEILPPIRPYGVELSAENIVEGMKIFLRQAEEGRKRFKASIEGATWNPQSLEELRRGTLFVIEEDALNSLVASAIASSAAAQKVKNIHIKIDGDVLKIEGEYKAPLMWVDFSAQLEFEQKNGRTSGSLKKIEAAGFDLGSLFKSDILGAFSSLGFPPPDDAELKDLSWVKLPGIVRFEITRDKVIVEREAPATGPS